MKKHVRQVLIFITAAALLFTFSSCSGGKNVLKSSKKEKTAVMTVDGYDVPLEIYRYFALMTKADYEAQYNSGEIWLGDEGADLIHKLNTEVEDTIIRLYTTLSACRKYGIDPENEYITKLVDSDMELIYKSYGDDYKAYDNEIRQYYMNDSVYRFIVRNDILAEELLAKMITLGEIPNDREELGEIIRGDDFIRVKQILVTTDNRTAEEAERRAELIYERAENGADFDSLIEDFGEDLYMFNNSDGYYFSRGTYHEEFENAAFALNIGDMSGIIRTSAGYSIIKRYEKDGDYISKHMSELCESYIKGRYNLALEEYMTTVTLTKLDVLEKYGIFNLESIK